MKTRGRVPTNGGRKYQIQHIWEVHHEIMRLALTGMKQTDIAAVLGVTPVMVSYTLNSELVRRQMVVMRGARDKDAFDASAKIRELVPVALARFEELLNNPDTQDHILLNASKDILDRAGYAPVKNVSIGVTHHLTPEDLARIKEVARENGYIVDAEVVEQPQLAVGGDVNDHCI